ncbi:helix-turn-helix domain-containing protein [Kribbella sp. NPDC051770]|uniref:helix-turn-helix domain-containing protein n=1 Tax=Kribbella sp. NPDC051770 TaxID=3155413 RepID=UPI00343BC0E5
MSSNLLNGEEAAEYLGVTPRWVRRAVAQRILPFVKVGHYVRFEKHELDNYIRASRVPAVDRG